MLLFVVLGVTGVLEMFDFSPQAPENYRSVARLTFEVPYGWLIRNMHYWAGQAMLVTATLHMTRVVLSGGYKGRRLNWLIGVALLVGTTLTDFTGLVLRWDENVAWALLVGTNVIWEIPGIGPMLYRIIVGADKVCCSATPVRFYTWHVLGLALPVAILIVWHLWRIRRDGGISHIAGSRHIRRPRAELVRVESLAAVTTLAALVWLSVSMDAPLGPPANLERPVDEAKAPWFFIGIQELLRHLPPLLGGVIIPVGALIAIALIPYVFDRSKEGEGIWLNRPGRNAQVIFGAIMAAIVLLGVIGALRR